MEDKVLIVDDEIEILEAVKRELFLYVKEKSLILLTVTSANEALELLKVEKNIILIISDQRMPGIKGSDFLLQAKELYPDIITIVLTAYTDIEEIIKAIKAGIFSFILKPWKPKQLQMEISKALEMYHLRKDRTHFLNIIKEELKWGGELQKTLLHWKLPSSDKISFSVSYNPVIELNCGGDYYDIFYFTDNLYLVLIGDVAGHGIKAAFITVLLKTIIYQNYIRKYKNKSFSPASFLEWLNNRICKELHKFPDILITFSACLINLEEMSILFSNAGHMPLLILRDMKSYHSNVVSPAIGFTNELKYKENKIKIQSNDKIILYTDGLIENETTNSENIKISKILLSNINNNTFNENVIRETLTHFPSNKFNDDVLLISIDIK